MTSPRKLVARRSPAHPDGGARLLSKAEVLERVGVTYPTLWKWMRAGQFPRARELAACRVAWLESEIEKWIIDRPIRRLKGDERAA